MLNIVMYKSLQWSRRKGQNNFVWFLVVLKRFGSKYCTRANQQKLYPARWKKCLFYLMIGLWMYANDILYSGWWIISILPHTWKIIEFTLAIYHQPILSCAYDIAMITCQQYFGGQANYWPMEKHHVINIFHRVRLFG